MKRSFQHLAALAAALCAPIATAQMPASVPFGDVPEQWALAGTDCVAFAVFTEARGTTLLEQAAIVNVIRNRAPADVGGLCAAVARMPELRALQSWTETRAPWIVDGAGWQAALIVTDAVLTDDYVIEPWRCSTAVTFTPEDAPTPTGFTPVCHIGTRIFLAPSSPNPAAPFYSLNGAN